MEDQFPIDVLICGAGAAGLTLAIDLARRGVRFRLIDKLGAPFAGSRGKGIQPRTQEVFEDLGLIDRLAAAGGSYPPTRRYRADGSAEEVQEIPVTASTAAEPYRSTLMVPQFRTEAILRERLAEFGIAPEYGCELLGFEQSADRVSVRIAGPNGPETTCCRYLVGGDGGRSTVRRLLGIGFPGETLGVRAVVADLVLGGLSRDAWHRFNADDRGSQVLLCPLPGTDLFQLQAPIAQEGDPDLSTAGVQAFLDARVPDRGLRVHGVAWASAYSMSSRLAHSYRRGRVLLMGDAAHVHPPTGGQGLNTSVQDAYNLGWKLGAVLEGAPDTLLDSYEAERRPIAASVLGLSTSLLQAAKQGSMHRGREVHQLDLGYTGSPLSLPDFSGGKAGPQAGDRAPDAPLRGAGGQPRRLFDLFRGPHWTLLVHSDTAPLPPASPRMRIHRVGPGGEFHDPDGHLASAYALAEGDMLLVRPDGYVGARVSAADAARLTDYLAALRLHVREA
ncbi:FAD-dependent oxidoreductase (plasmid) [Roseomonas gilardii subsp. gilardii]|uniref:FAD-dependent oxidoreductase n=1 Tax=Roseomonas gilardii TaxID=257708 RepID=UPI001FF92C3F|nr:FAD-dependent oxidoreductase [Roseomonas gilardii]UPG74516.1 FAD-dependent oxidoreductase [Roseomonas gilardii subsp. gilardii]